MGVASFPFYSIEIVESWPGHLSQAIPQCLADDYWLHTCRVLSQHHQAKSQGNQSKTFSHPEVLEFDPHSGDFFYGVECFFCLRLGVEPKSRNTAWQDGQLFRCSIVFLFYKLVVDSMYCSISASKSSNSFTFGGSRKLCESNARFSIAIATVSVLTQCADLSFSICICSSRFW